MQKFHSILSRQILYWNYNSVQTKPKHWTEHCVHALTLQIKEIKAKVLTTTSTGSSPGSTGEVQSSEPGMAPSRGGMMGTASGLIPLVVICSGRKWSSQILCSVEKRPDSRNAASHTLTRPWSAGKLKKRFRGLLRISPGFSSLWFWHPRTTHFTMLTSETERSYFCLHQSTALFVYTRWARATRTSIRAEGFVQSCDSGLPNEKLKWRFTSSSACSSLCYKRNAANLWSERQSNNVANSWRAWHQGI